MKNKKFLYLVLAGLIGASLLSADAFGRKAQEAELSQGIDKHEVAAQKIVRQREETFLRPEESYESTTEEETTIYAAGELIIKFKPEVAAKVYEATDRGGFVNVLPQAQSLDRLNEKYGLIDAQRVFKALEKKDEYGKVIAVTTAEEKAEQIKAKFHKRSKRMPKGRKVPDLENIYLFKIDPNADIAAAVKDYQDDPSVVFAQPNHIHSINLVPNDPYYNSSGSWGQGYDDLWALKPAKVNAEFAWSIAQGEGITVAVIDTGVDYYHRDILSNIWINDDEIPYNGIDDDGNGYIDDVRGWDLYYNDSDPLDNNGHGTHVTGTIAAVVNNNLGIVGMAPQVKIMALKGLSAYGSGFDSTLGPLIQYAADNGADILNNSWGPSSPRPSNPYLEGIVDYAYGLGCIVIFSAGNSNNDVANYSPANHYPNVIAVAATDMNDGKASFSNYGNLISVSAPGVDILSLRARNTDMYGDMVHIVGQQYYRSNGTSMAAPHVSGLAAQLLALKPELTNIEVRQIIENNADSIVPPVPMGTGRINATNSAYSVNPRSEHVAITRIVPEGNGLTIYGIIHSDSCNSFSIDFKRAEDIGWTFYTQTFVAPLHREFPLAFYDFYSNQPDGTLVFRFRADTGTNTYEDQQAYLLEKAKIIDLEDEYGKWSGFYEKNSTYYLRGMLLGATSYAVAYSKKNSGVWETAGVTQLIPQGQNSLAEIVASIDLSQVSDVGEYTLRIQGNFGTGIENAQLDFSIDQAAWIVSIPNSIQNQQPLIADLDGDNKSEIIIGVWWDPSKQGLYVINHNGVLNTNLSIEGLQVPNTLAAENVNGIPGDEILVVSNYPNRLHLYTYNNETGKLEDMPGWPITKSNSYSFYYGAYFPVPFIEDLDGDNIPEIIACLRLYYGDPMRAYYYLAIYTLLGQPYSSTFPRLIRHTNDGDYGRTIDIVTLDLDDDGQKEIIISTHSTYISPFAYLRAYKLDGSEYLNGSWPVKVRSLSRVNSVYDDEYIPYDIEIGDITGDGEKDIVFINAVNEMYVINKAGTLETGWPVLFDTTDYFGSETMAIADVDQDNIPEIIFGYNNRLHIYKSDGRELSGYPLDIRSLFPAFTSYSIETPVVGDIDGDNEAEIIARVQLYKSGGTSRNIILALNLDGSIDYEWDMYGRFADVMKIPGAVISDIDKDGKIDIVAANNIMDLSGPPETKVFCWKLDVPYDRSKMQWPMFKHDNQRTGQYNHSPIFDSISNKTLFVNNPLEFSVVATDYDGDPLSFSVTGLPAGASFTDNGDKTATFSWTPSVSQVGSYGVTFNVSDGVLTDSETIIITVMPRLKQPPRPKME